MLKLTEVSLSHGEIRYNPKIVAVPTETIKKGNTTINNMGTPEKSAYFSSSHMITCQYECGEHSFSNVIHWESLTLMHERDAQHFEVESEAARRIAPMLRAVADEIEKQVARYDDDAIKKSTS